MLPLVIRSGSGILGSDDVKTRKIVELMMIMAIDDNGNDKDNDIQVEGSDFWWIGSVPASRCF